MRPILNEMSLTVAAAKDDEDAAAALVIDEFAYDDSFPHGALYRFNQDAARELGLKSMTMVGMAFDPSGRIWFAAEGGDVLIFDGTAFVEDGIDDLRAPLRDLLVIEGGVFVCGGNHQVYRRKGIEDWVDIGPGDDLRASFPENHFEALDAFTAQEIYAAGRDGVIWWFDGSEWTPVQTATNLSFLSVSCGADGVVYLGGQGGIVAIGRHDAFELYSPPSAMNDIWGIAHYQSKTYVAMTRALMTFSPDDGLVVEPDAMELGETFYTLKQAGASLWSFGQKDVLRLSDGGWIALEEVPVVSG